ncbi:uncharacterized protein OCT59_024669 [Rhizophagus irregularis]|nr:hypothetical protein OCT59_024669 [Rhizophagus irregularis]
MKNINISISEGYSGQDALISYITKNKIISYCRFLKSYCNIIVASITNSSSTFSDNWNNLDNLWAGCFLCEGKDFPDLKDKQQNVYVMQKYCKYSGKELLRSIKRKKNLVSALASHSENVIEIPTNDHSISVKDDYCKITKKNASHSENVIETPTNDHSISVKDDYYKITKKNNIIDFCCDILQELDGKYNIHPFYKYDEKETAIKNPIDLFTINSKLENNQYTSIKEFEKDIRLIFCNCYAYNNIEKPVTKQIRILEQNKDKLVYNQVVNNAFLIASAYENLVADQKCHYLLQMQAIVESLLPLEYSIPELSLVMDDKFNTNVLEKLDKIIEKEDEKVLLGRSYAYWSKEYKETKQTTIGEILDSGVNQLKSYMNIISKVKQVIILVQEYLTNGLK